MKHRHVDLESGFHVLAKTKRSEAATMVIERGKAEGGIQNRHHADQWLYVISGEALAKIEGKRVKLETGSLLLISAGEWHEIKNIGPEALKTLNIYASPEF